MLLSDGQVQLICIVSHVSGNYSCAVGTAAVLGGGWLVAGGCCCDKGVGEAGCALLVANNIKGHSTVSARPQQPLHLTYYVKTAIPVSPGLLL